METRYRTKVSERNGQIYTFGSAARQLNAVPVRKEDRSYERDTEVVKRQKRKSMSFQYVLFLAAATVITMAVCVGYLQLRAEVDSRIEYIGEMEIDLKDAKAENDANYNYVMKDVDLEEIRRIATEELGMTYAAKDQVVLYESEESDYVRQYEEIPDEEIK